MKRKLAVVAGIALAVFAMAFGSQVVAYINVGRLPAFYTSQVQFDSLRGGHIGGHVLTYKCAATLKVGDVVYRSTSNTVNKSSTITNYNAIAGVVVGGTWKGFQAAIDSVNLGDTACVANGRAVVLNQGRTWVDLDAAGGVVPGGLLFPSTTTAGLVKAAPAAIDTFLRTVGRAVDTGATSAIIQADINVH